MSETDGPGSGGRHRHGSPDRGGAEGDNDRHAAGDSSADESESPGTDVAVRHTDVAVAETDGDVAGEHDDAATEVVSAQRRVPSVTRRDARVSKPKRHPQWLINQLPVGMLGSEFFVRFVSIFQEMAESLMDDADQVEHVPEATVTPTAMLPYLASWIDVRTVDESLPEQVQRAILRGSAKALALRGTKEGLERYLRMLSDTDSGSVEVTDGGGVWREGEAPDDVAWVRMRVATTGHLSVDEFVALIRDEIPAHVRAELYVSDRCVLRTEEE